MASPDDVQLSDAQLAELSRLADGTLDPRRRPDVEVLIAASPELRSVYERERGVVERFERVRTAERAPARLRARLEAERSGKAGRVQRRAGRVRAVAGALAAAAVALVLVLPSGTPGSPSVSQAAALALRGAAQRAPAPDPSDPAGRLARRVDRLYFPNWVVRPGWRAVGQRSDVLGSRRAATVYYRWRGMLVAYTIVDLPALAEPAAPVTRLDGYLLRTLAMGTRTVVTWRRARHTCVLSAAGVPASALRQLAVWNTPGLNG